ncbi:MAG: MFS transporter [Bacteroidia bacterium]
MASTGSVLHSTGNKKPRLSFRQILNMSVGFFGIQFGFGLQNANMSRIFQTLGAEMDEIPILWIAAPLTGLLVQPIIGFISDKTWHPTLGRRRPFFLIGAILSAMALFFMPNAWGLLAAAITLWILDSSINISMEPFRAFVADLLPSKQRTTGFAAQSFFIGLGAVLASILPAILEWVGVSNEADPGILPNTIKWSFYLGGFAFLGAVLWTVFTTKEYSPQEVSAFESDDEHPDSSHSFIHKKISLSSLIKNGLAWLIAGIALSILKWSFEFGDKQMYVFTIGIGVFGLVLLIAGLFRMIEMEWGLNEVIDDMLNMPKTMKQLAVVQFFTWFALFSMWIYTTGAVTQELYGTTDTSSEAYNTGANWVGICFGVYNGVAALFAFALPLLAKKIGRKKTHLVALMMGGLGLLSIFTIQNHYLLLISMVGVGIAWASILSMPYAILAGSLPPHKNGVYMGIFNFFIVIPQLVAASILGYIVGSVFAEKAVYALLIGGISMIIAGFLTLLVNDVDEGAVDS